MVKFAAISPHPPLLLPNVGSKDDKLQVKRTVESLNFLAEEFKKAKPDEIIISSPHPDWGFNVPLYFLAKEFKGAITPYLTEVESPAFYFQQGKEFFSELKQNTAYALIASGDLSHCLKDDGPYGFHPDGPKFDKALIEHLKQKDVGNILKLDATFPEAGECGLRPICFMLGILEASGINWQAEILSYEAPFGVGYLVALLQVGGVSDPTPTSH